MHHLLTAQQTYRRQARAFTRLELAAALAALALLAMLVLPALASSQSRGHVAQCLNNLRLIGRAVQAWGTDFSSSQPPWRVRVADGGLMYHSGFRPGNAWFDFQIMSNHLVTPRVLVCPADSEAKVARAFTGTTEGFYVASGFRGLATSYTVNLHAGSEFSQGLLSSDMNLALKNPQQCGLAMVNSALALMPGEGWTNAIHGITGNIVAMDGSASPTTTAELWAAATITQAGDQPNSPHILKAR